MSTPSNSPTGAVPVGGSRRRRWLAPLLLGLLALIVLLALLTQCDGGDPADRGAGAPASAPAPTAPAATPASSGPAAGPAGTATAGAPGTVTAGGADLLGTATAAGLASHDGQQTAARAVKVQSVPADEGFWVGADERNRLWVRLTDTGGESDYRVKQGDTVDFTGVVTRAAPGFAAETGVTAAEGADQLTRQGHYIAVPASGVTLAR